VCSCKGNPTDLEAQHRFAKFQKMQTSGIKSRASHIQNLTLIPPRKYFYFNSEISEYGGNKTDRNGNDTTESAGNFHSIYLLFMQDISLEIIYIIDMFLIIKKAVLLAIL